MTKAEMIVAVAEKAGMTKKDAEKAVSAVLETVTGTLKKGDKITTIGGIVGTIVQVNDDTIVIETSDDRVRMELTKWAVSTTGVQTSVEPAAAKKSKEEPAEEPAAEEKENSDEKKPWDPEK